MRAVLAFTLLVVAVIGLASGARIARDEKYTTKYDNIDLDSILKNDRLLNNYLNCLLDKGRCTPEGNELKRILPDALASACTKCNPNQRKGAERVIRFLLEQKPDKFRELEAKFDPQGVYRAQYEAEARRRNIQV